MTVTLKHPETGLEWETDHLPSRLLSLAVSSDYGGEIFTEDDSVNITAFERSLRGHWYDQFVQMYQDGKNLDARASELDDEIDQLLTRVTDRIRRKGEITGALDRLDRLEKGELSPPNRDTVVDPAPMTETERKSLLKDIMGDLHAYPHLPPDQWQNIEAIRSVGERLFQRVQDDLQELRLEYDFLAWRKALLEQAITNCKRYGDFRRWQEFREESDEPTQKPSYITDPPEDLFKGAGTKDRVDGKRYARKLAKLFADSDKEISENSWSELHTMMKDEKTGGRNKVDCIRNAFKAHPETEDPPTSMALSEACYHFFDDITFG